MTDFRAEGEKLHQEQPELMLCEVSRFAFTFTDTPNEGAEYIEGYQAARARRDAFLAEQKEGTS